MSEIIFEVLALSVPKKAVTKVKRE